jgi:hypothetical protein
LGSMRIFRDPFWFARESNWAHLVGAAGRLHRTNPVRN